MKGSHDSLSGYPLRNWWISFLSPFSRCQNKTLQEQLNAGVIYFDLRFRKVNGKIYGAHGLAIADITINKVFSILNAHKQTIIVRCIVEDGLFKDNLSVEELVRVINLLKAPNIIIHKVGLKSKWSEHIIVNDITSIGKNDYTLFEIKDKINELNNFKDEEFKNITLYEVYSYKSIIPYLFARVINKHLPVIHNDNVIIFQDFL